MRIKTFGVAVGAVVLLGAFLSAGAFAAATTTDVKWYTGESPGIELPGAAAIGIGQVGESTFATTVSGTAVKLHSTNIECEGCTIENVGGSAVGKGKLKFTGVTVAEPASCSVASTITTKALVVKADYMIGTVDYVLFEPEAGSSTGFASFELKGASCPLSTTIIPKGTVFVQPVQVTGTQAIEPEVNSSATINTTAGGALHVGVEPASLTWTAKVVACERQLIGTH